MAIHLKVKPFQETLNAGMCGPASLKIIFAYYGLDKSEKELARLCRVSKKLGTTANDMAEVARHFGFKVLIKNNSSFKDIEKWLARGVPLIVDWFTRGRREASESESADGHASVVCGIDKNYIYMQDPEIGRMRKMKRSDFMRVWFDFLGEYIKPGELVIRQIMAIYK